MRIRECGLWNCQVPREGLRKGESILHENPEIAPDPGIIYLEPVSGLTDFPPMTAWNSIPFSEKHKSVTGSRRENNIAMYIHPIRIILPITDCVTMMASSLPLAPAEDPASHNLFGLVCSCVRLKISPATSPSRPEQGIFRTAGVQYLILTGESNHE